MKYQCVSNSRARNGTRHAEYNAIFCIKDEFVCGRSLWTPQAPLNRAVGVECGGGTFITTIQIRYTDKDEKREPSNHPI